jgi:hypothetical protein
LISFQLYHLNGVDVQTRLRLLDWLFDYRLGCQTAVDCSDVPFGVVLQAVHRLLELGGFMQLLELLNYLPVDLHYLIKSVAAYGHDSELETNIRG